MRDKTDREREREPGEALGPLGGLYCKGQLLLHRRLFTKKAELLSDKNKGWDPSERSSVSHARWAQALPPFIFLKKQAISLHICDFVGGNARNGVDQLSPSALQDVSLSARYFRERGHRGEQCIKWGSNR